MNDSDWDIRQEGRAWQKGEAMQAVEALGQPDAP
jgi:hypothetical protein